MTERVAVAECERGRPDGVDAVQGATTERGDVVNNRRCEQGVELIEVAVVEQVSVERDQLDDRRSVLRRDCHRADRPRDVDECRTAWQSAPDGAADQAVHRGGRYWD